MIGAYIRVSTERQKKEGVSLEAQRDQIISYALNFEFVASANDIEFYIDEGKSAKSLERPQMRRMISDIKKRKLSLIFVYDISRISRDIVDYNTFKKMLIKYGVQLKSLYEKVDDDETAGERFTNNVKVSYYQFERERTIERTNDGLRFIAESGRYPCGGRPPYGYKRNKNKELIINEKQAEIVKIIFEMASNNYDAKTIRDHVNSLQKEKVFITYEIKEIVKRKIYIGEKTFKGKLYKNIVPAIITSELYESANKNIYITNRKNQQEYLFDNLVFCSICGSKMTDYHAVSSTGRKYYYYKCSKCNAILPQKFLENYVEGINIEKEKKEEALKEINKELYSLNRRISKIKERYLLGEYTDREYCSLAICIEDRLTELQYKKDGLNLRETTNEYSDLVTKEEKRQYIQATFKKITVDPYKRIVIQTDLK